MNQITIGDLDIDVIQKDIKNVHLAVYPPKGRVRISAPLYMNEEAIRLFAISKLPWIKHQQRKFRNQERESPREYIYRETHYFFGNRYLLNVIEHEGFNKVIKNSKTIDLYIRRGVSQSKKQSIMNEWYRKEIKKVIPELLHKWEKVIGVEASDWGVKLMKTKWGSCNREAKRIWLNLELVKKPVQCLEYIIVHELVHLLERYHNDNFERYMDTYMPQWRSYKEELNRMPVSHANWRY
jgi:predicted metal-dependent hydrolase